MTSGDFVRTAPRWYLLVMGLAVAIVLLTLTLGGWHLYVDHQNFDKMVLWVYQKQVQEQRAAQQQQQRSQAQPPPALTAPPSAAQVPAPPAGLK